MKNTPSRKVLKTIEALRRNPDTHPKVLALSDQELASRLTSLDNPIPVRLGEAAAKAYLSGEVIEKNGRPPLLLTSQARASLVAHLARK